MGRNILWPALGAGQSMFLAQTSHPSPSSRPPVLRSHRDRDTQSSSELPGPVTVTVVRASESARPSAAPARGPPPAPGTPACLIKLWSRYMKSCSRYRTAVRLGRPSACRMIVRRRPPPALRAPADSGWAAIGRDARLLARRWFASPSFQSARPGRSARVHPPLTCGLSIFPPTNVTSSLRPAHWHRVRPSAARPSACPSICRRSPARPLPG